ncbi:hypothetical protein [Rhizorhabdus dicambivorans]|nr:hypothetical protein [Rhizorhabdus dicambivorans]
MDTAAVHDELDALKFGDVGEGIVARCEYIGVAFQLEGADIFGSSNQFSR